MLPFAPKSFGRLTDVLASAYASIGGSTDNNFKLRRVKNAVVVVVDGLGASNLRFQPGHAPFLNSHLNKASTIDCGFPATTATSLTSLATGVAAGSHPIIGYQVFDKNLNQSVNLLTGWGDNFRPARQTAKPISQIAAAESKGFIFCGPPEYETSGFTQATMPGATYLPEKSIEDRFDAISKMLKTSDSTVTYLYVPELDQTAHAHGSQSQKWLQKLEELDGIVKRFVMTIPKDSGVLLTADHGIVDVPSSAHLYLDEAGVEGIRFVGGDPRVNFVYFSERTPSGAILEAKISLQKFVGNDAYVCTPEELISAGWYTSVNVEARDLMPDLFVISKTRVALYHRAFAKQKSLQMIGQHGSFSIDEVKVPMLKFGAFA